MDARRHTKKANTPAKKRKWAEVASEVLSEGNSEGSAVRVANAAMKRKGSARG